MSTRFPDVLASALDRSGMVSEPAAAAREMQVADSGQPEVAGPSGSGWTLSQIALLGGEALSDPLVAAASSVITASVEGRKMINELAKVHRDRPRIKVEAFATSAALSDRQIQLTNVKRQESDEAGLHGFTFAYVRGGASLADESVDLFRRLQFIVGVRVPSPRPKTSVIVTERDWVETSVPFRTLQLAETIFHELLHVWWQKVKADPVQDLLISDGGSVEVTNTGHGDDTSFHIDSKSLLLVATGTIEPEFLRRLHAFVKEAGALDRIGKAIALERREFESRHRSQRRLGH